ncbi:UDP-glucose 4-epimerase GalE [Flexibacterium corallicola]|uniref:UDP-glucose 4-epimerase GalE n=1 Tax=Flexibacterium corallicola TaxID=3037259 RepID=UPI00286F4E04|nr:UDP-glucose 4-epimerase GalE [Pseudovibrio sp. M1P-2-3]
MSAAPTVLVTGGAGFIGSHTCKALHKAGYTPVTFDNLSTGNRSAIKWGPLETGDILDEENLCRVIAQYKPVAVIHFAALAYVGESEQDPARYYKNNVSGLLCLLSAMKRCDLHHIVFSSSCATYGLPQKLPIGEDQQQEPINAYGRTKLIGEQILEDFRRIHGFHYGILRYFNAAGADLDGEIGEDHDPETHLIPNVLTTALGGAKVKVFGTDYDTPDGTCIRDYIHVADLADAHLRALTMLTEKDPCSFACNLGSGRGVSIMEIIKESERLLERPIPFQHGPRRAGDPPFLVADTRKAQELLGWAPRHSDLSTILRSSHAWLARKSIFQDQIIRA